MPIRSCPRCLDQRLRARKLKGSGTEIDFCDQCKGIWFEARELEQAAPEAMKDLEVPGDAEFSKRLCPDCVVRLARFTYPQTFVEVDVCEDCAGVWLDAGEFKEIVAVRKHHLEMGELETHGKVPGIRGVLIRFIDGYLSDGGQV